MQQTDTTRFVHGEIMAPGSIRQEPHAASLSCDVIEADFETLPEIAGRDTEPSFTAKREMAGLSMLTSSGLSAPRERKRGGPLFWAAGLFLMLGAFWVSGGHSLVEGRSFASGVASMRLVDVQSRVERHGERALLIVDGAALNDGGAAAAVPGLAIDVHSDDGSTTRYFLGTNDLLLEPGARFPFSSRLVAPREGVKSVSVTFRS
ncbi:hypothetical protein [Nitratireductor indicus]|uniref:hypothetical protein n=1 Tax=Nitratireductor indicus TaxID=721133 RepID=UPI00287630EC|nr:hypothetical protein [Nitratireductor indicus]MDS1136342.1 hypothetical protein [Nitratireductor indicus]